MTGKPQAAAGMLCPLRNKDVSKVCHKCAWFEQVRGQHPQTGEPVDKWACAISLLPMLMIENSQQQRQTGAAVESFRNEMTRQNAAMFALGAGGIAGPRVVAQQRINGGAGGSRPLLEAGGDDAA